MSKENPDSPESQMNFNSPTSGVAGKVGRDQNVSHHHHYYSNTPSESPKERDDTQQKLLRRVDDEVEKRYTDSLQNRIYIVLGKKSAPGQVQYPEKIDIKIGDKPSYSLPKDTPIQEIFDWKDISGKLLILGAPGAGKTTMLLKLAKPLVEQAKANPDRPIPVLLNLSSWKEDKQSIKDWMIADLKAKYGVRQDIAKKWIEAEIIIPLLDGLDELAAARQEKCVEQINDFLHPETWSRELVVCSRLEEYQHYSTNLGLNGSIILKPLTTEQIQEYILKTEGEYLWNHIKIDSDLMELAKTPLFLNIIILSYQEISFEDWSQFKSSKERRRYLFNAYIERMLKRDYQEKGKNKSKPYEDEDTKIWLAWLAKQLIRENKTEFLLIEKMQPTWLENIDQENIYRWIYGLTFGIISGVILGIITVVTIGEIFGIFRGLIYGIIFGITFGLIYTLIYGLSQDSFQPIKPIESLKFAFDIAKFNIIVSAVAGGSVGLILGLILGLIKWLIFQDINNLFHSFFLGFLTGELIGITYGFIFGLENSEIKYKHTPNQGIRTSVKNIAIFTSIAFVTCVGLFWLLISDRTESISFFNILIGGFGFSLLFGIIRSGLPVIQHFSLRLVLWLNRKTPWNYARFLDYSTDRLFLQRVGGGYRFVHDLLRQHFAEKYR